MREIIERRLGASSHHSACRTLRPASLRTAGGWHCPPRLPPPLHLVRAVILASSESAQTSTTATDIVELRCGTGVLHSQRILVFGSRGIGVACYRPLSLRRKRSIVTCQAFAAASDPATVQLPGRGALNPCAERNYGNERPQRASRRSRMRAKDCHAISFCLTRLAAIRSAFGSVLRQSSSFSSASWSRGYFSARLLPRRSPWFLKQSRTGAAGGTALLPAAATRFERIEVLGRRCGVHPRVHMAS
jgi:hypothetical protein